ncbi:hypothetical protein B484DRAFT_452745 [Ochromonadaceae sp. CCMP2298]|nr:hypothetical protein B484DRAFT_452745 [Ochromonadaceae sp. CCMP2298]
MWTKQFDEQGRAFYFNAALGRSEWAPPADSTVHVAPELAQTGQAPTSASLLGPTTDQQDMNRDAYGAFITHNLDSYPTHFYPTGAGMPGIPGMPTPETSIQQKLDDAVQKRNEEMLARRQRGEVKKPEASANTSSYLKQKSELEAMAGSKGAESGKWLVR